MTDAPESRRVLLDTHILIHFVLEGLSAAEQRILKKKMLAISDIVLWEIAKLNQRGRIRLDLGHPKMVDLLRRITIFPITADIATLSCALDFNSDPADELIAATSVYHNVPLITRDEKLRGSTMVNTL